MHSATGDGGATVIGSHNNLLAYSHVAHDCRVGDHVIMSNVGTLAGHVVVEDYAIVGGLAAIHQFCRIGRHAFCGMDSSLNRDVPPYVTASGHFATPRGVNVEGLKRHGFSALQIRNIRGAYKIVYRSELKLEEALAQAGPGSAGTAPATPAAGAPPAAKASLAASDENAVAPAL